MWRLVTYILIMGVLVGCGAGGDATPVITARPTQSPTPLSTPLAYIATPIPAGFPENPLQLVLVPANREEAEAQIESLEARILEASDVNVKIVLADRTAEAVTALCRSGLDVVSAVWVDSLGYASARAQECGTPVLRVEYGEGRSASFGREMVILYARRIEGNALSDSAGRTFCRLGYDDLFSWVLPTLAYSNANVALDSFSRVRDFETYEEMFPSFTNAQCDVTAMPADVYNAFVESDTDGIGGQLRVVFRSIEWTSGVMFVSPLLSLDKQERLIEAFLTFSRLESAEATPAPDDEEETPSPDSESTPLPNEAATTLLQPFLGAGRVVRALPNDFSSLNGFLDATNINFAGLGQ